MKTARLVLIRIGVVCLTLLWACQTDKLPKPTQEGKNTFGCKIDGRLWIPDGSDGFMPIKPISGGFSAIKYNPVQLGIYIRATSKNKEALHLYLNKLHEGVYQLNQNTGYKPGALSPHNYGYYQSSDYKAYGTSAKYTGSITITRADTLSGIISGNFEFAAGNSSGTFFKITEGRFDINVFTLR